MDLLGLAPLDAALWTWPRGEKLSLIGAVRAASRRNQGKAPQITFETVFTAQGRPFDAVEPQGMVSDEILEFDGVQVLKLVDAVGPWVLAAVPSAFEGVFQIVSGLPTTHPRWGRAERWIRATRSVSRCFLDHADFASIGAALGDKGRQVEVEKVTARVVEDHSSWNRGFPVATSGLRPSPADALQEIADWDATVRSLTLTIAEGKRLRVHLRRSAGATFYSGDFRLFEEAVLARLELASSRRRALVHDRQRRTREPVRPVAIHLSKQIFRSAKDTGEILDFVRKMTDVTLSVFRRNPYLHVALTDETDGSNFDLVVTEPDQIELYPGYRASSPAFARIVERLSERFGAATVADSGQKRPVSLDELASTG